MTELTARQKMRWVSRTKKVDDALVVVISSLALLHQALDLDDFRRNRHSRQTCGAVWGLDICNRRQQCWREFRVGMVGQCAAARLRERESGALAFLASSERARPGEGEKKKSGSVLSGQQDPCLIVIHTPARKVT